MEDRIATRVRPQSQGVPKEVGDAAVDPASLQPGVPNPGHTYMPPAVSAPKPKAKCVGGDGSCGAWPMKGQSLCYGHSRSVSE